MYGVIFDLDGTLLDTQRIYVDAWDYAGHLQGYENCGDHVKYLLGANEEKWCRYVSDNFPGTDSLKFRDDVVDYIKKNIKVRFKDGAKEFVEYLRQNNIPYAIGSGGNMEYIVNYLKILNVLDWFPHIVSGDLVENSKPAPDTFLLAAQKIGVEPQNCIVFEDSDNGVLAAKNAGMRCIGIPDIAPFNDYIKSLLYKELTSMDEAIEIFEKF